jgi:signal transduction histidine kinase
MSDAPLEPQALKEIPSPSLRLWIGLSVILSIFIVFVAYTAREVRWLEDFQTNVVQRNRKSSLQLLRIQGDSYLLAISLRDMAFKRGPYPLQNSRPQFDRLRRDMQDAVRLEAQFSGSSPSVDERRAQLRSALDQFGRSLDHVFDLAQRGEVEQARSLILTRLDNQREVITETISRLLVSNDQAQVQAAQTINAVYESVKKDILIITAVLLLIAFGTGFYTFQANRKTFEKLRDQARLLQAQSGQLRKLSWKMIDLQEETLRQVSRDLHDEFGQILTAIGVMLKRASRQTPGGAISPDGLAEVENVRKIVEETLQKVRDQSQIFRPAILDDFGLDQSLEWFASQFSGRAGIPVHFSGSLGGEAVSPDDAIHLYRIAQEALNNIARHSKATEARITLRTAEDGIELEIRDNGAGFDPSDLASRDGVGLMGMRERAEHLNGRLSVRSAPGQGATLSVWVPRKSARVLSPPVGVEKVS